MKEQPSCEHYIYLQEPEEASSPTSFSGIPLFAQSRSSPTAKKSSCSANEMASFLDSLFGRMSKPSTERRGKASSRSFISASRAKTSPPAELERELKDRDQGFGPRAQESSVRYDLNTLSWKTHRCLWEEDLPWSSVTLPEWGMMLGGSIWELTPLDLPIIEPAFGWLPTMRASIATHGICWKRAEDGEPKGNLEDYLAYLYVRSGGKRLRGLSVSASFATLLMAWPLKWAHLEPLGTGKFQSWLQLHSGCSALTPADPAAGVVQLSQ